MKKSLILLLPFFISFAIASASLAASRDASPTEVAEPAPVVERNFSNPQVDGFYIHPSTGAGIACYLLGCDGGYASSRITGQGRKMMGVGIWRGYELMAPQSNDDPYITGLTCDCQKAIETLTRKANNGDAEAMHGLGHANEGLGNHKKAFEWWSISAELGVVGAQADLGNAYLYGQGTPVDLDKAEYWLTKAVAGGRDWAQQNLIEVYQRKGDTDKANKLRQKAIETLTLKTINGNTDAMNELASLYNNTGNYDEAFKWWKQSAELGNNGAQAELGHAYLRGQGTPQDLDQAEYWLLKAAEQGDAWAQRNLAELYKRKGDTEKSDEYH